MLSLTPLGQRAALGAEERVIRFAFGGPYLYQEQDLYTRAPYGKEQGQGSTRPNVMHNVLTGGETLHATARTGHLHVADTN